MSSSKFNINSEEQQYFLDYVKNNVNSLITSMFTFVKGCMDPKEDMKMLFQYCNAGLICKNEEFFKVLFSMDSCMINVIFIDYLKEKEEEKEDDESYVYLYSTISENIESKEYDNIDEIEYIIVLRNSFKNTHWLLP